MVSAKSMPAVTPPPVKRLPSRTTRPAVGIAPNAASRSRARPMRRGALAAQQAGGAEHQRAGADRGDIARLRRLPAQEVEHLGVLHQRVDARTARHADHVERRAVASVAYGSIRSPVVRLDRFGVFHSSSTSASGQLREHLERSGQVELRHPREQATFRSVALVMAGFLLLDKPILPRQVWRKCQTPTDSAKPPRRVEILVFPRRAAAGRRRAAAGPSPLRTNLRLNAARAAVRPAVVAPQAGPVTTSAGSA